MLYPECCRKLRAAAGGPCCSPELPLRHLLSWQRAASHRLRRALLPGCQRHACGDCGCFELAHRRCAWPDQRLNLQERFMGTKHLCAVFFSSCVLAFEGVSSTLLNRLPMQARNSQTTARDSKLNVGSMKAQKMSCKVIREEEV